MFVFLVSLLPGNERLRTGQASENKDLANKVAIALQTERALRSAESGEVRPTPKRAPTKSIRFAVLKLTKISHVKS